VGLVTAGGDTAEALFSRLLEARPVVGVQHAPPTASIEAFEIRRYLDRKGVGLMSRTSQLACAAASRLPAALHGVPSGKIGVVLGSAWTSLDSIVRFERQAHLEGPRLVDPLLFTETVGNVPAGQVSIHFGWSALNATVSTGASSGLEALRRAVDALDEGRARAVVAGGADEVNLHLARTLAADGRCAPDGISRPFTEESRGPLPGEGACLFAVEPEREAAARGAAVLGRLGPGVGVWTPPGRHDTIEAAAERIRRLLDEAGLPLAGVDLLVLSGNGDPARDGPEVGLVRALFGTRPPALVAPKAVLGETWGAAGPIAVAVALEAMRRSMVPPAPHALRALSDRHDSAERPVGRDVRHALVLDCCPTGRLAALIVGAAGEKS
jgi:3-oxoacyl-[acyl-carrier-protein] synthase II